MRTWARFRQAVNAGIVAVAPARYVPEQLDWQPATVAEGSFSIFTAADAAYLKRFGPTFLSSLLRQHPEASVHFHLYDADAEAIALVGRWRVEFPDARIGYSTERLPEKALRPPTAGHRRQSWRSLFICCSRFLAAQRLHEATGAPLLLMDIDVIFGGLLVPIFAGTDYALMPRLSHKNWCKRTLGGVVYASYSPTGRAFLAETCLQIRKFLSSRLYWFAFDQYALYRALLRMRRRDGLAGFRALTPEQISFDLAGDAPILYAKGNQKHQDAYISFAERFAPGARAAVES